MKRRQRTADCDGHTPKHRFSREVYDLLYRDHPRYSPEHYQAIKRTHTPFVLMGRACRHLDKTGEFVNIAGGLRKTIASRGRSVGRIYLIGSSHAFGAYCDDDHTVASLLQILCDRAEIRPGLPPFSQYQVVNHGTAGSSIENTFRIFVGIRLRKNDIVLFLTNTVSRYFRTEFALAMRERCGSAGAAFAVFLQPNLFQMKNPSEYEKDLLRRYADNIAENADSGIGSNRRQSILDELRAGGVPVYDLQSCVERPHACGEIFIDPWHVSFKGNKRIAEAVFEFFLRHLRPDAPAFAREAAADDLRETVRALCRDESLIRDWLEKTPRFPCPKNRKERIGAIVMNCNPFTLGHSHIVCQALERVERLYLFVVSEERSEFTFAERAAMVLEGIGDMRERVLVAASGAFIISSLSFPEYFCKDKIRHIPDTTVDALIFGTVIAPALGIDVRFFGEEPLCKVTRAYHRQLRELLPGCGVDCVEIPRFRHKGEPVSASRVRELFRAGDMAALSGLVPLSTLRCLKARLKSGRKI
jgi:hypothetical protein